MCQMSTLLFLNLSMMCFFNNQLHMQPYSDAILTNSTAGISRQPDQHYNQKYIGAIQKDNPNQP